MKWSVLLVFCLLPGCASTPPPPPEEQPPPAVVPAGEPAPAPRPEAPPPPRDPSVPPPEVEPGCLPNCAMIHGKCQALVDPGPAFDGEEQTEEIGPGGPRGAPEQIVKPCPAHCCRDQVD